MQACPASPVASMPVLALDVCFIYFVVGKGSEALATLEPRSRMGGKGLLVVLVVRRTRPCTAEVGVVAVGSDIKRC